MAKKLGAAVAVAIMSSIIVAVAQPRADPVALGRKLSNWSSPESGASLFAAASPELKERLTAAGGGEAMARAIDSQLGAEVSRFDEFAMTLNGLTFYHRLAAHQRAPAVLTMLAWDDAGVVQMATTRPATPPLADDAGVVTRTRLALPFGDPAKGKWFTYWGGSNVARNYHIVTPDQRYAYDFVVVRDGQTVAGAKENPASYFCWGQPVLAVADGTVVTATDGVADNVPVGQMNRRQPPGNHVVIEHLEKEYSLSAHLKSGSVSVKEGQKVKAGEPIGQCGNSGNSSEPHLHFHMQTTGTFGKGAEGLPASFRDVAIDGKRLKTGAPRRGQFLSSAR